jgi:hypothetical protein
LPGYFFFASVRLNWSYVAVLVKFEFIILHTVVKTRIRSKRHIINENIEFRNKKCDGRLATVLFHTSDVSGGRSRSLRDHTSIVLMRLRGV